MDNPIDQAAIFHNQRKEGRLKSFKKAKGREAKVKSKKKDIEGQNQLYISLNGEEAIVILDNNDVFLTEIVAKQAKV
jgi:hypothetical protein